MASERRYGVWAGNPKGIAEDVTKCIEKVWDKFLRLYRQCQHKRGYGPEGLYCKQHAKKHEAKSGE